MSTSGVRQPGCRGFSALGPWLCVLAFQRVCPFAPQFLILSEFAYSTRITERNSMQKLCRLFEAYKNDIRLSFQFDRFDEVYVILVEKTAYY